MPTDAPAQVEPVCIGPTWERDAGHPSGFKHPERSLGWAALAWAYQWLRLETGEPWLCTPEQERFVVWWYAIDERGRFVYRDGVFQRLKGHGKDPLGAVICAIEFLGPCRFDPDGPMESDPYGTLHRTGSSNPSAWVQTAAVAKDQTRTTMTIFPWLFSKEAIAEYGIDIGKEIIYAEHGRRRIECVTSSPGSLEGMRSTFMLRNETHWWLDNNEGHEMDRVIARNLAKAKGGQARALSITNAYQPGLDSVAERAREAYENIQTGRAVDTGIMYDSLEAPPEAKLSAEDAPAVVRAVRGDSTWLDVDRIVQEILDPRNPPSTSRRFYYNQIVAAEDAWCTPQEWDALANKGVKVAKREVITLGFDGSKSDDHTALMGCRVDDGHVFTLGVWDPEKHRGEAPREAIDGAVRQAFEFYDVVGFYSDLHPWESYVDAWDKDLGRGRSRELCVAAGPRHRIAWDMRARQKEFTVEGAMRVSNEIEEGAFTHDGDARVRQHVHNARRRPNAWGVSFGKEARESKRKVDALAALILARMARRAYLALPERRRRRRKQRMSSF